MLQPRDASKPAQPGGCAQCHTGLGMKPNPVDKLTGADYANIDCLLCHAPGYRRTVVKEGDTFRLAPAPGIDVLAAARKVGRPTNETCLRCHLGTGGGPNHKHGVTPTSAQSDVHVAAGLVCVDCHKTSRHRIAGGSDLFAIELPRAKTRCDSCHDDEPHKGAQGNYLNDHTGRIACQTCHIPMFARDPQYPTITARDWTRPVLNERTGLYGPTNTMASNGRPVYRWWNRKLEIPRLPLGSREDRSSKIYPWKPTVYTVISDAATSDAIYIKAGVYAVTGDPGAAAKKGAEDAKQPYSGTWRGETEAILWSMNHQVAPAASALKCGDCHSAAPMLDYRALGYDEATAADLMSPR